MGRSLLFWISYQFGVDFFVTKVKNRLQINLSIKFIKNEKSFASV